MAKKKRMKKKKSKITEKVQVQIQPVLVDNFVALQRVMVNLASKFDNLNTQLTKLLEIFETSAKSLAKKGFKLEASEGPGNEKVFEKISELSEQNKVIAKGLTLMHEAVVQPIMMPVQQPMPMMPTPVQMPPIQRLPRLGSPAPAEGEYKKSAPFKEGKENIPSPR